MPGNDDLDATLRRVSDCIVHLSFIEAGTCDDWLQAAADIVRTAIAPNWIVSLLDARNGLGDDQWNRMVLAVSARTSKEAERWRKEYLAGLSAAGVQPVHVVDPPKDRMTGHIPDRETAGTLAEQILRAYRDRLGAQRVRYFGAPIHQAPDAAANDRMLYLAFWTTNPETAFSEEEDCLVRHGWLALHAMYDHCIGVRLGARDALLRRLTPVQRDVAELLATSMTEQRIADHMGRSRFTVHDHIKSIYRAWSVRSRPEFMNRWNRG